MYFIIQIGQLQASQFRKPLTINSAMAILLRLYSDRDNKIKYFIPSLYNIIPIDSRNYRVYFYIH